MRTEGKKYRTRIYIIVCTGLEPYANYSGFVDAGILQALFSRRDRVEAWGGLKKCWNDLDILFFFWQIFMKFETF